MIIQPFNGAYFLLLLLIGLLTAAITQYDGPKNDEFIEGAELQFDWVRIYQKN